MAKKKAPVVAASVPVSTPVVSQAEKEAYCLLEDANGFLFVGDIYFIIRQECDNEIYVAKYEEGIKCCIDSILDDCGCTFDPDDYKVIHVKNAKNAKVLDLSMTRTYTLSSK